MLSCMAKSIPLSSACWLLYHPGCLALKSPPRMMLFCVSRACSEN